MIITLSGIQNNSKALIEETRFIFNHETGTIFGYDSNEKYPHRELIIPSTITVNDQEYKVEHISFCAFEMEGIEKLVISEGIRTIGDFAFWGNYINELILPKSLEYVGDWAFQSNSIDKVEVLNSEMEFGYKVFWNSRLYIKIHAEENSKAKIYAEENEHEFYPISFN